MHRWWWVEAPHGDAHVKKTVEEFALQGREGGYYIREMGDAFG